MIDFELLIVLIVCWLGVFCGSGFSGFYLIYGICLVIFRSKDDYCFYCL